MKPGSDGDSACSRGIPAGYVNTLEKRLAETERALFFALAEIHDRTITQGDYDDPSVDRTMQPSVLFDSMSTTQQEKADLVASWTGNPLRNRAQAQAWFQTRRTGAYANVDDDSSGQTMAGGGTVDVSAPSAVTSISRVRPTTRSTLQKLGGHRIIEDARQHGVRQSNSHRAQHNIARPADGVSHLGVDPASVSAPLADSLQASKARNLAQTHEKLYF